MPNQPTHTHSSAARGPELRRHSQSHSRSPGPLSTHTATTEMSYYSTAVFTLWRYYNADNSDRPRRAGRACGLIGRAAPYIGVPMASIDGCRRIRGINLRIRIFCAWRARWPRRFCRIPGHREPVEPDLIERITRVRAGVISPHGHRIAAAQGPTCRNPDTHFESG